MRGYNIKMPTFPQMPNIVFDNSVSSIDFIVDTLDTYFDTLNSSFKILDDDLNMMKKTFKSPSGLQKLWY